MRSTSVPLWYQLWKADTGSTERELQRGEWLDNMGDPDLDGLWEMVAELREKRRRSKEEGKQ